MGRVADGAQVGGVAGNAAKTPRIGPRDVFPVSGGLSFLRGGGLIPSRGHPHPPARPRHRSNPPRSRPRSGGGRPACRANRASRWWASKDACPWYDSPPQLLDLGGQFGAVLPSGGLPLDPLLSAEELGPLGAVRLLHLGPDRRGGLLNHLPHSALVEAGLGRVHDLPPTLVGVAGFLDIGPLPLDLSSSGSPVAGIRPGRLVHHQLPVRSSAVVLRSPLAAEPPRAPAPSARPSGTA